MFVLAFRNVTERFGKRDCSADIPKHFIDIPPVLALEFISHLPKKVRNLIPVNCLVWKGLAADFISHSIDCFDSRAWIKEFARGLLLNSFVVYAPVKGHEYNML